MGPLPPFIGTFPVLSLKVFISRRQSLSWWFKMGRTLPTFRNLLDAFEEEWKPYRRSLRRGEQKAFDELMGKARMHASSSMYQARANPFEAVVVSILLEMQKEIDMLKSQGKTPD
jgi:hypothetical protein